MRSTVPIVSFSTIHSKSVMQSNADHISTEMRLVLCVHSSGRVALSLYTSDIATVFSSALIFQLVDERCLCPVYWRPSDVVTLPREQLLSQLQILELI